LIGFLPTLIFHVRVKGSGKIEGFSTFKTFIGFLSSVFSHMDAQGGGTVVGFPTFLTFIGFLACCEFVYVL
ncbi:unnamed protein product, partial [Gulo gulo]